MNLDVNTAYKEWFLKKIRLEHAFSLKKRQITKIFNDFDKTWLRHFTGSGTHTVVHALAAQRTTRTQRKVAEQGTGQPADWTRQRQASGTGGRGGRGTVIQQRPQPTSNMRVAQATSTDQKTFEW